MKSAGERSILRWTAQFAIARCYRGAPGATSVGRLDLPRNLRLVMDRKTNWALLTHRVRSRMTAIGPFGWMPVRTFCGTRSDSNQPSSESGGAMSSETQGPFELRYPPQSAMYIQAFPLPAKRGHE
jgi:hypothetical protein